MSKASSVHWTDSIKYLNGTNADERYFAHIENLQSLRELTISESSITDAFVEKINSLKSLQHLQVEDCQLLTDNFAKNLKNTSIQSLSLCYNDFIGDLSCKYISGMVNLTSLTLSATGVTDEGLMMLLALPKLETLYIHACLQVTNKMIRFIKSVSNLGVFT